MAPAFFVPNRRDAAATLSPYTLTLRRGLVTPTVRRLVDGLSVGGFMVSSKAMGSVVDTAQRAALRAAFAAANKQLDAYIAQYEAAQSSRATSAAQRAPARHPGAKGK